MAILRAEGLKEQTTSTHVSTSKSLTMAISPYEVRESDSLTRVINRVGSDLIVFLAHEAKVLPVTNSTIVQKTSRQI